jgi:hypothetical protein
VFTKPITALVLYIFASRRITRPDKKTDRYKKLGLQAEDLRHAASALVESDLG